MNRFVTAMPVAPGSAYLTVPGRAVAATAAADGAVVLVESGWSADQIHLVPSGSPVPDGGRCIGAALAYGMPAAVYATGPSATLGFE